MNGGSPHWIGIAVAAVLVIVLPGAGSRASTDEVLSSAALQAECRQRTLLCHYYVRGFLDGVNGFAAVDPAAVVQHDSWLSRVMRTRLARANRAQPQPLCTRHVASETVIARLLDGAAETAQAGESAGALLAATLRRHFPCWR